MKVFNSIRWRLQIWYGLILLAVLAGFGVTAFQLERGRQLRRIDDELQRRANLLAGALRPPPRGGTRPDDGPRDGPPSQSREPRPFPPPFEQFVDGRPPERDPQRPPRDFHLPATAANLFDDTDTNGFYFVIWWRDGNEFARSTNAPAIIPAPPRRSSGNPPAPTNPPPSRATSPEPQPPRMRGAFREMVVVTPPGEIMLVGRSIVPEMSELQLVALELAAAGGVILLFGLAGGWWLAARAIRPIGDISTTAEKISAGDLSQRINAADTESELGQLAGVLNSTFARLEAVFARQQQFTSDAAHELRTPLSVVLTQTQSALSRERPGDEYRESLEACQRAAQRMRRLTEALLELARLDSGQEAARRVKFDLAAAVQSCIQLVRPLANARRLTIHTDLATAECTGDPDQVSLVVTNLLSNAIHYNQDAGEIRVTTRRENGRAQLTVTDTGVGISTEDLPHLFERFYRADKSRSRADGRTGLGLAIAKAVVDAHNGTIEVSSQPDAGATFTVRLPAGTTDDGQAMGTGEL